MVPMDYFAIGREQWRKVMVRPTLELTGRGFNAERSKFSMKATLSALWLNWLLKLFDDKSISCLHEILDETDTLSQLFSRNRVWSRMAGDGPQGSVSNITPLFGNLVEFTAGFSWIVVVRSPASCRRRETPDAS